MCYNQGELQTYLDHEITGEQRWKMEMHLESCSECQTALDQLKKQAELARANLGNYNSMVQKLNPDTEAAWQKLANRYEQEDQNHLMKGVGQFMNRNMKITVAAVALILLASSFSFAPVRSAVADFLGVFRMEKVETVNISPQELAGLEQAMRSGGQRINVENFGNVAIEGKEGMRVVSFEEAEKAADFSLKIPNTPLAGFGSPTIRMQSPMKVKLTLDVEKVNALIESFGGDKLLPQTVDGKTFTLDIPTAITAEYPSTTQDARSLMIAQARSPEITVPDGVDANEIRDALVGLKVLPESFRQKLAAVNDWQHTLLIPSIEGSSKEVSINGYDGVFITSSQQAERTGSPHDSYGEESPYERERVGNNGTLIWPQNGIVTVVEGDLTLDGALAIASFMK